MSVNNPSGNLKEELRIKGNRPSPEKLPELVAKDFSAKLWAAVNEPSWVIADAAYYVHEHAPTDKITLSQQKEVERTWFWLQKELALSRGQSLEWVDKNPFTPGDIMRLLWEKHRNFSLKVWALYRYVDMGQISFEIDANILRSRYEIAAKTIWYKFKNASVDEVVGFLAILPDYAKSSSGEPLFAYRSPATIKDYVKEYAQLKKGHRTQKINLIEYKDELLAEIISSLDV